VDGLLTTHIRRSRSLAGRVTATTGSEAIKKAQDERPGIIFMDILMPDMDGYEACRLLQAQPETKGIPVVFVSSKQQKADHVWAKMQGGKTIVGKPYAPEQIVEALKVYA
jgi:twitching motility two-component system response regulator PilH